MHYYQVYFNKRKKCNLNLYNLLFYFVKIFLILLGRGKPGWGRETTRPPWWPKELPWANVRMDARCEDEKQKVNNHLQFH